MGTPKHTHTHTHARTHTHMDTEKVVSGGGSWVMGGCWRQGEKAAGRARPAPSLAGRCSLPEEGGQRRSAAWGPLPTSLDYFPSLWQNQGAAGLCTSFFLQSSL